jgi:hypothetical protein
VESSVYGRGNSDPISVGPYGVLVNAKVGSVPVVLIRAEDVLEDTEKLSSSMSLKILILKMDRKDVKLILFPEWKIQFLKSPELGDRYIEERLEA